MIDKLLLYKALKNKSGAEISASGNPVTLSGTLADNPLKDCKIYGWSKQDTTKGKNLFDFSKLVSDDVNVMDYEKQTITVPAKTNNTGYNQTLRDLCPGITPGTYVFSMKRSNPESGAGSYFLEAMKDFLMDTPIELTDELLDNHIAWYNNQDSEVENVISEIQVEKGTEATAYEPYTGGQPSPSPEYPQEIESAGSNGKINLEVHGKNLFDLEYASHLSNWMPGTYKYIPYYVGKGNKVSVSYSEKLPIGRGFYATIGLDKGGAQRVYDWLYHSDVNIGKTQFTFTAKEDYIHLNMTGNNIQQSIKELKNLQIEVSPSPTSYEPYHEPQSISIQTPTGLPAIPVNTDGNYTDANGQQWTADYVDLKRGKYVQNVWQETFDGSESWETYITTGYYLKNILPEKMTNREVLCNQLRRSIGGIDSNTIITGAFGTDSTIYIDNCTLRDNTLVDKGLSNWKAHLAEHPLVVMTYLDEPIERDLTPSEIQAYQNLVTYAGTTIVENDADCYMEVSAGGGDALRAKKMALILGD